MSETTPPSAATTYRLDRRFVLGSVGVQVVGAGLAAMLAFVVWEWIGVLAVALLLNAVRLALLPPAVVRADRIAGRDDVFLHVVTADAKSLQQVLHQLQRGGAARVTTMLRLAEIKPP